MLIIPFAILLWQELESDFVVPVNKGGRFEGWVENRLFVEERSQLLWD